MATMSGASTSTIPNARKGTKAQDVRQNQRRWIQLIDSWHSSSSQASAPFGTASRDQLVDEIAQHAQTLCRSINDRQWQMDAFQMAINAVLFPITAGDDQPDNGELSRIEQLGQQLLQLAIHSVAMPYLASLEKEQTQDNSRFETVKKAIQEWEQFSKRLAVYQRLRGLQQRLSLPILPLALVLREPSSTVLLCLASLPKGADIVGPLLQNHAWLVEESAPIRLSIVAQVHNVCPGSTQEYASLAASGLLIGWRDGRESSMWSAAQGVRVATLGDLVDMYGGVLKSLRQNGSVAQASALVDVLAKEWQGQDAQQAIAQLRSASTTDVALQRQRHHDTTKDVSITTQRFDLVAVQTLAANVFATDRDDAARKQLVQELLSTARPASAANRVTQLLDTNDSAAVRSFGLEVVSQAAAAADATAEALALVASVLYARPAVGQFRWDLNTTHLLLKQADAVLDQLKSAHGGGGNEVSDSILGDALRQALETDQETVVPACQLLALLSNSRDNDRVLADAQMHLNWLRSISSLVESQTDKPAMDLCWLAAYGGSDLPPGEAESQQSCAFDAILATFSASRPPPSSSSGNRTDPAVIRFRAEWDAFFHESMALTGSPSTPFALIPAADALHRLLSSVLRTGDIELFRLLSTSTAITTPTPSQLEKLVLDVSTSLFDQASIASTRNKDVRLSTEVLSALPATSSAGKVQRDFIEAACRLSSFQIKSIETPGAQMGPREIRATKDRLTLIARLLATHENAHRSPDLILDLAKRLCALQSVGSPSSTTASSGGSSGSSNPTSDRIVEARTMAMLVETAMAAEDFDLAAELCSRLIDRSSFSASNKVKAAAAAARDEAEEMVEIGWRTCFQLSKHPSWPDTPARIGMLSHAMTMCPPAQLTTMLRQWHALDQQLKDELDQGKEFASTKKLSAAAAGMGIGMGMGIGGGGLPGMGMGWLEGVTAGVAGVTGGKGMGGITASTAATVGAGLVGTAANFLPIGGLGAYFGTHTSSSPHTTNVASLKTPAAPAAAAETADQAAVVDARTARLFDFDSVSGAASPSSSSSSTSAAGSDAYMDPTERAVRAARSARDFLGWKQRSSAHQPQQHEETRGGGGGGGGFSFSRGVGWLIGDGERQ